MDFTRIHAYKNRVSNLLPEFPTDPSFHRGPSWENRNVSPWAEHASEKEASDASSFHSLI
jgi:hypothetical protein